MRRAVKEVWTEHRVRGVFARDPDALIDLVELELNDDILKQEKNKAVCKVCEGWLYNTINCIMRHKTICAVKLKCLHCAENTLKTTLTSAL